MRKKILFFTIVLIMTLFKQDLALATDMTAKEFLEYCEQDLQFPKNNYETGFCFGLITGMTDGTLAYESLKKIYIKNYQPSHISCLGVTSYPPMKFGEVVKLILRNLRKKDEKTLSYSAPLVVHHVLMEEFPCSVEERERYEHNNITSLKSIDLDSNSGTNKQWSRWYKKIKNKFCEY